MNKKYCIFLTVLFSLFIGGILVGSLLAPDKEFSELENRYLQTPPKLSWENLQSGKFMEDAEDYVNDHVIGRDLWVALKAWSERLSGKQENNGVYFGKEDTLLNRVNTPSQEELQKRLGYVDALVGNVSVPVYLGLIPSSSAVWSDRLPTGAPTADELKLIEEYRNAPAPASPRGNIGIPLCLNMYELLPFWHTFWTRLGFAVHTSPVSSRGLYLAGQATIPSDTACFPAKLSHGHIKALSQMHLDAIFYPCLTYNFDEGLGDNHYNCPVVAYYPEVLAGNCPELEGQKFIYDYVGIHRPKDFVRKMAKEVLPKYFGGISEKEVQAAADAAYAEHEAHMAQIRVKGSEIIDEARRQGKRIIVLAGRPYHVDPEINHGIDHLITRHGAAVVTEDSISNRVEKFPTSVLNQWTYHSRLYAAAKYCTTQKDMDLVQLVSFGCGVDAITTDETREILQAGSKLYTQLKIDEITNLGAVNIRLRSLFAALEERDEAAEEKAAPKAEA